MHVRVKIVFGVALAFLGCVFFIKKQEAMDHKQVGKVFYYNNNKLVEENIESASSLSFLYNNPIGSLLRFVLKRKVVAQLYGMYKDSSLSKKEIAPFVAKHGIAMEDFEEPAQGYASFNEFFIRKLKPGSRPIAPALDAVVSPADGKLFVIPDISKKTPFFVKNEQFALIDFVCNQDLARRYEGGTLVIARLAPPDYHRFHLPLGGYMSKPVAINGVYESVNPIAYAAGVQPLTQNERHCITLQTESCGLVTIIPVGAMFVGKIKYTHAFETMSTKGDELGYFEFGGSTVVLLFEPGMVTVREDILRHSAQGYETNIVMGEQFATINAGRQS